VAAATRTGGGRRGAAACAIIVAFTAAAASRSVSNTLVCVHLHSVSGLAAARQPSRGSSTGATAILSCISDLVASTAGAGFSAIFSRATLLRLPSVPTAAGSGQRATTCSCRRAVAGSGSGRRSAAGSDRRAAGADVRLSGGRIGGGRSRPRHKAGTAQLDYHVVQNGYRLRCEDHGGYREKPSRVRHDMKESRKDAKQALNVLAHGLLQAVENMLLLRRGLGVGGD